MATAIAKPAAIDVMPTLAELEETLRVEHAACISTARTTLEHALAAGDALLQIRALLMRSRRWTAWLEANDEVCQTQAYRYMRLATYRDHLPDGVGINEGADLLAGLPALDSGPGRPRLPDPLKEDAERLRREGRGYKAIAKELGISPSTVHNWFNGTAKAHRKRAQDALRKQKRERAIKAAVSKVGGALAESYAASERLDDLIGQAHREAEGSEARRELAKAHEHQRAMRDAVVRALGVES